MSVHVDPLPDEFHVLSLCGTQFWIDADTRKEIEAFLRQEDGAGNKYEYIIVESIVGEEVTVLRDAVNMIWSSTPLTRERADQMMAKIKAEAPIE